MSFHRWLDITNVTGRLGLKPGVVLKFVNMSVYGISKSALNFAILVASPGGSVVLHGGLWLTYVCAPPSLVKYAVATMARSAKSPKFT